MTQDRYLFDAIQKFLKDKMVFLGGPRQVGKTTLSQRYLLTSKAGYLNWDSPGVSKVLIAGHLPPKLPILVFDEIHKYKKWRNLVKGLYDTYKEDKNFIITGSARLDHYRKGGDSLVGRYYYLRLHPFSILEFKANPTQKDLNRLLEFGGFPEPLFKADSSHWRLWQKQRQHQVIREDLRDLERVQEISLIELLVETLPSRVGAPLSINNLREDVGVDHKTIQRWINILENLYFCFRILPFGSPKIKAVKKEQKLYLWDWSLISDSGARFENLMASQLLKYCHYIEDTQGFAMELRYLRDTEKREVDFVVLKNKKPLFAVECKRSDEKVGPQIEYFKKRTNIPVFYQVTENGKDFDTASCKVRNFISFCKELKMV